MVNNNGNVVYSVNRHHVLRSVPNPATVLKHKKSHVLCAITLCNKTLTHSPILKRLVNIDSISCNCCKKRLELELPKG